MAVEGCVPGREAERCPGVAQLSVQDGKRKEENRNSKRKKDIPMADTPQMKKRNSTLNSDVRPRRSARHK